jgi:predicted ATPase/class 3 adenylate cyclase
MGEVARPAGTVTFLFTDIEGSTGLWDRQAEAMSAALARHDATLRQAVEAHGGVIFATGGDGFAVAFEHAYDATAAAGNAQQQLRAEDWPDVVGAVLVRMGLHTGEADERDGDYFGPVVNRAARLMGVAHGGQVVMTRRTAELLGDATVTGTVVDLGSHRLRDLREIEHVYQLAVDGIPADFPPLRSLDAFDHNLPMQRTDFVGRATELDRVSSLLAQRRLVTVSAVGGAGKTRLALEVGATLLGQPFDGVHFVDLGPIDDPEMVGRAVGEAVQMPEGFGLAAFLRPRRQLLILDNCEHLLDAAAELVDELLVACPDLTILATSREALDVEGEQLVPLGPLDPHGEGVELFISRARLLDPTYAPDARRREVIEQICDHLDGLPLAIEMAAARVRDMVESELLSRLDDRFAVLRGGRRRVDRQRTLEAAIDWSYDLLSEESKAVLRRMTVFAGLATVRDVAAICAGADGGSVVESLQDLVNANLVVVRAEEYGTGHTLLETIQHYAARKISEAGEVDEARNRHLAYYADRAVELITSVSPLGALAWDLANMRAAVEHGLSTGADDLVITIYGTFGGLMRRVTGVDLHPAVERAAHGAGGAFPAVVDYIHLEQVVFAPDLDEAARLTQLFLDTRTPDELSGWPHYPVWSWVQGWSALFTSAADPQTATQLADELADTDPDGWLLGLLNDVKMNIALASDDAAAATALARAGVGTHWSMVVLYIEQGVASTIEALDAFHAGSDDVFPYARSVAAVLHDALGDPSRADTEMEIALRAARSTALPLPRRWALTALAELQRQRGEPDEAANTLATVDVIPGLRLPVETALFAYVRAHLATAGGAATDAGRVPGTIDVDSVLDGAIHSLAHA